MAWLCFSRVLSLCVLLLMKRCLMLYIAASDSGLDLASTLRLSLAIAQSPLSLQAAAVLGALAMGFRPPARMTSPTGLAPFGTSAMSHNQVL